MTMFAQKKTSQAINLCYHEHIYGEAFHIGEPPLLVVDGWNVTVNAEPTSDKPVQVVSNAERRPLVHPLRRWAWVKLKNKRQ